MTEPRPRSCAAGSQEPATRRDVLRAGAGLALATSAAACASVRPSERGASTAEREHELGELFADLDDQRASVDPIREPERRARRERLAALLRAQRVEALLVEPGATLMHLTGVSWGLSERLFGAVVTADAELIWIVPAFEAGKARARIEGEGRPGGELVTWDEHEYPYRPLASALAARRVERLAVEPALRSLFVERLGEAFGRERLVSGHALVLGLRACKDAHELELMRRANELTQRAIVAVSQRLRPGHTAAEIGEMMDHAHRRLGLRRNWSLVLIGPDAAVPHGDTNAIALARGDVILIDTGGGFHDYQSDNTRTWVFDGAPTVEVERAWHAVRDAQRRAYESLRPGVVCSAADALARAVLDERGYGPGYRCFTHRLGHGIGLEGHEDPYFDGGSQVELAPGMTLSDEPGVYLVGQYGVRLEDIVAITPEGADHFGDWQRDPRSPD